MSDDHTKRVAEIEAVLGDYAEVFEPPMYVRPAGMMIDGAAVVGGEVYTIMMIDGRQQVVRMAAKDLGTEQPWIPVT